MSAEIKDVSGIDAELTAGSGGIFDIVQDGKLLYSKHSEGRFPDTGEIGNLLKLDD